MALEITLDNVHEYLAQHEKKELLRFVAVGSVDDGKSTLIGRLLYDSQGIYDDQLAAVESASKRRGSAGDKLDLALLTDGLRAEREQGITIDVAYRYFSTDKRKFIIADTPGHVQYTRNMATGASTADVALILIDARHGVIQQSRRHAYIAALPGIPHLAVCVNKMDLVDFAQEPFEAIRRDFLAFAADLSFKEVRFLPVSAIDGDNIVHASPRTPWNDSGTVLGYLEEVPTTADLNLRDFRFPVQYVLRPNLDYRGFCGQVASGVVSKGDEVLVLPSGRRSRVAAIDTYTGEVDEAFAPMSVTLRLEDEVDVSRGDMFIHPDQAPIVGRRFEADLVWMNEKPLDDTASLFLKHTTRMVRAHVDRIVGRTDLETLGVEPAATLDLNDIARVEISCNQPVHFDAYGDNRSTGAFVLIDSISNNTVAAGMIRRALEDGDGDRTAGGISLVSPEARRARLGHGGALIAFAGEPEQGQREVAQRLERGLFERGFATTLVDVAIVADGSRSPALLADIAAQCVRAGVLTVMSGAAARAADREELRARFQDAPIVWIQIGGESPVRGDETICSVSPEDDAETVSAVLAALDQHRVIDRAEG